MHCCRRPKSFSTFWGCSHQIHLEHLPSAVEHSGPQQAEVPDVPQGLGQVGGGGLGLSHCLALRSAWWVHQCSHHLYPAHLHHFHQIHHWVGSALHRGLLEIHSVHGEDIHDYFHLFHHQQGRDGLVGWWAGRLWGHLVPIHWGICLGLGMRWVVETGVRWERCGGCDFGMLYAHFWD